MSNVQIVMGMGMMMGMMMGFWEKKKKRKKKKGLEKKGVRYERLEIGEIFF